MTDPSHDIKPESVNDIIEFFDNPITRSLPCSVYAKDLNGVYLGCSQYMLDWLVNPQRSEPLGTIRGKTDSDLLPANTADILRQNDLSVIQNNTIQTFEEFTSLVNGITTKIPLVNKKGQAIGILGISTDITELKKYQAALERAKEAAEVANKAKSEFLASMSHDLRTPLNAILGFSEILQIKHNMPVEEQQNYIRSVHDAGKLLLNLIEDILDFTSIEAGKYPYDPQPIDLRAIIESIIEILVFEARKKNIELILIYHDNVPRYVIDDAKRIKRIVTNLVNNAIKFTEKGHIIVSMEALSQHKKQAILQFAVEDTGIGIPPDKLEAIFERFNRVEPSYQNPHKGSGLGLAIVKSLVSDMNGSIHVNSQLHNGSTFSCTLPFKLQLHGQTHSSWQHHFKEVRFLVVSDNAVQNRYLTQQLSKVNYHLITSDQIETELALGVYQILLVDDNIIHRQVKTLVDELRQKNLLKQVLPLLIVKPDQAIALEQTHFFAYFIKPVQPSEFFKELMQYWFKWNQQFQTEEGQIKSYGFNVLVVEDDAASANVAKLLLEDLGCTVTVVHTAEEALMYIYQDIDVAFIDIGLPDINGLTLIQRIQKLKRDPIPLITLSAHTSTEDRRTFLAAGAAATLTKPITRDILQTTLVNLLNRT